MQSLPCYGLYRAGLLLNLLHKGFDRPERALPITRELTEIAPTELNSWKLLAEAHFQLKQGMEAIGTLEKALTCPPLQSPAKSAPPNASKATAQN